MITPKQVEFYRQNGYLAVENVYSAADIADLRRVTDEFVEKSRQVTKNDEIFDLEPTHTPEKPQLRRLKSPGKHHPVYRHIQEHPNLVEIVSRLIGASGVRFDGGKLNMKISGVGSPVEWHQDWAFYPHTNDDLLAVGVCLDDSTLENGALLVIPGSHKGRVLSHHQDGAFVGAVTEEDFRPDNAVPIEIKAGGVSIHHVRMLHGSAPNRSPKPRRVLFLQYCAGDAWPLLGTDATWETYASSFLRGQPTQTPRVTAVPVRIPRPRPAVMPNPGSIYESQTILKRKLFADAKAPGM